jgi:hypothetical protein
MLQKDVKISVALVSAILALSAIGYGLRVRDALVPESTGSEESSTEGWTTADVGGFAIALPPGWEYRPSQGIDSLVGDFVGDGVTLNFDYGWYSNSLAEDSDPAYVVTHEIIDGIRAKMVVPGSATNGTTGVYFEGLGSRGMDRLQISGSGLTDEQQDLVLQMFRTIQFSK